MNTPAPTETRPPAAAREAPTKEPERPAGPRNANEVDRPPRQSFAPAPEYPHSAHSRGIEGSVELRLLIDERGLVQQVIVEDVKGHPSFGKAAERAVRNWRFQAAQDGGRAVAVWARKTIDFEMDAP